MSRPARVRIINRRKGGILRWIPRVLFLGVVAGAFAGLVGGGLAYIHYSRDLPELLTIEDYKPPTVSSFYAHDGRLLGEFTTERRIVVPLDKMPRHLIEAFLASEDQRFFEHDGVDLRGIARAALTNFKAGRVVEGASTITQQLCKTLVGNEKSLTRKIKEAILARRTETQLTKLEILYLYMNQIYLGHGAYGVQAAAQNYFRKDVWQLDLAESAMIAGLPPAPSRLSPARNYEAAREKQRRVLDRMVEEGFVATADADDAWNRELTVYEALRDPFSERAPYFTEHVRRHVQRRYGYDALNSEGLRVYMTVDADFQRFAQDALREGLLSVAERQGYTGPLHHIDANDQARLDEFIERATDFYGGPGELDDGRYYLGLVSEVGKDSVDVQIGDVRGRIPHRGGMEWAVPYDIESSKNGRILADPREALSVGDVVLVRKNRGAKFEKWDLPALQLSQEPRVQGALVSLDPRTGYVVSMVGGYDYDQSEYNRAFQGCRQPGSVFKPLVYSRALDMEYTLATPISDVPIAVYDSVNEFIWKPKNYEGEYEGEVILRNALIRSMNIPSVNVIRYVGADNAVAWAKALGITTPLAADQSLVLGSSCVYPWDIVQVYAVFALRGRRPRNAFIKRVEDRDGRILEDRTHFSDPWAPSGPKLDGMLRILDEPREHAMPETTAYLTQTALRQVVESGTAVRAKNLQKPAGGKTGTTDAFDAWFLGFTESLITGVWVGSDLNKRRLGNWETGGKVALPIWLDYMKAALLDVPQRDFTKDPPPGIVFANVDYKTGLLAARGRRSLSLPFKRGTVPKETARSAGSYDNRDLDALEGRF
jgi:penicillin-binding protein 1A